jgi:hypothetical protein
VVAIASRRIAIRIRGLPRAPALSVAVQAARRRRRDPRFAGKMEPMVNLRLYRLSFLPTLVAVVAIMFSLEGTPAALEPATPPATFDGQRAANQARQIVSQAPERPPGSAGDEAIADLVAERFGEVAAGSVTEQRFEAEYEGEDVSLRNVLLTLPGDPASTIVVLAGRDAARGAGAASSAAATGILIELANALGLAGHEKTLVLASTSGTSAGAAGARELLDGLPERDSVEAVIVISQPGAVEPRRPFVITSSSGRSSGPVRLERTAALAVATQAEASSARPSAFTQLARLAIPSGIGDQAPLIAAGLDAVAISSAGERPLAAADDGLDQLATASVDAFGRATQSTVDALDTAGAADELPDPRLELSDNLIPGWTVSLLALTLILPAAIAAIDSAARAVRRGAELAASLAWAAARGLPFLGALAALYGLALVGVVPRPPFPFDPGLYELGARGAVALALILAATIASAILLRWRGITAAAAPGACVAGLGLVAATACAVLWLANPYLALLAVPLAHVWLLADRPPGALRAAAALALGALACLPVIAALVAVARALDLGSDAPWTLTIMVADGQVKMVAMIAGCFLIGAVLGTIALCLRRDRLPVGG